MNWPAWVISITAAVSVISKIRLCGAEPVRSSSWLMSTSSSGSPIESPERLTSGSFLSLVVMLGEQRDRLFRHPSVDLLHHSESFGDVEERGWRYVVAVFVAHSQEQVVLGCAAGGELHDRLGLEANPSCCKAAPMRCAQVTRPFIRELLGSPERWSSASEDRQSLKAER